jgi:phospholipase C
MSACVSSNQSDLAGITRVKHIVVIMQENRSVDNLFNGFPGADTAQSGFSRGQEIPLQPMTLAEKYDLDHSHPGWGADLDHGLMDGFDHTLEAGAPAHEAYSYVPRSETVPIWNLAAQYTFGDRMFQSNSGPSFPAHQYMIAGQSGLMDENPEQFPWGCDAAPSNRVKLLGPNGTDLPGDGIYPCLDYPTIADILDAAGVSWRDYAPPIQTNAGYNGAWSAFQAIRHIRYGPDWTDKVISPQMQFLTDVQSGTLAQVTWIVPDSKTSDHAGGESTTEGPDWVGSLVNAIGTSKYWDSTVVFISWDDWGGWYDHVVPPNVDKMGLGFRVPLIIVSPFAKRAYVSHEVHEFSGFLRYTEERFNLPNLGTRDVNADDFSDCFDYSQTVRPYQPVTTARSADFFIHATPAGPGDDY